MPGKLKQKKIFCFLCNGILIFRNNDKSRVLDHLQVEHRTNCNLDFLISASILEEGEKVKISKIIEETICKTKHSIDSEVVNEKIKEPAENKDVVAAEGDIISKSHIDAEESENTERILSNESKENVMASDDDTIVVDGSIVLEPLANPEESEKEDNFLAGESAEYCLPADLEPLVQTDLPFEELVTDEYTPNVVEVDVVSSSDNNQCPICDVTFTLKKSVRRHLKNIHKIYKDVTDPTTLKTIADETESIEETSQIIEEESERSESNTKTEGASDLKYKCEECGELQSWKDHYRHLKTAHNYSVKAAIKSVARTKKRLAEEKLESSAKKTCWSKRVNFDQVPYDELASDINSDLAITTDIDKNIAKTKDKSDEDSITVDKPKMETCQFCNIDVYYSNMKRHMISKHFQEMKKEPVVKIEFHADNVNETVHEGVAKSVEKQDDQVGKVIEKVKDQLNGSISDKLSIEDSDGRMVCKLCDANILVTYLKRHMRRVHKANESKIEVESEERANGRALSSSNPTDVTKVPEGHSGTSTNANDFSQVIMNVIKQEDKVKHDGPSEEKDLTTTHLEVPQLGKIVVQPNITEPHPSANPTTQDSGVFLERLKLKLLLDSDDEEETSEEGHNNAHKEIRTIEEATETDRKNVIDNLKPKDMTSKLSPFNRMPKSEQEILKDPSLPSMWLVRYITRPEGRTDREFISPDNKRIRSIVKMLEFMTESKQYTLTEIERVKEYFKKPRTSLEQLKSLEINKS